MRLFYTLIIKANIQAGFKSATLVLFNLEVVLLKLKVCLYMLIPPAIDITTWEYKILSNFIKLKLSLTLIQLKIIRYISSLPFILLSHLIGLRKALKRSRIGW